MYLGTLYRTRLGFHFKYQNHQEKAKKKKKRKTQKSIDSKGDWTYSVRVKQERVSPCSTSIGNVYVKQLESFAALRRSQRYTVKAPWLLIFDSKLQQIGKFTNMEPANNEDYLLQSVPVGFMQEGTHLSCRCQNK